MLDEPSNSPPQPINQPKRRQSANQQQPSRDYFCGIIIEKVPPPTTTTTYQTPVFLHEFNQALAITTAKPCLSQSLASRNHRQTLYGTSAPSEPSRRSLFATFRSRSHPLRIPSFQPPSTSLRVVGYSSKAFEFPALFLHSFQDVTSKAKARAPRYLHIV